MKREPLLRQQNLIKSTTEIPTGSISLESFVFPDIGEASHLAASDLPSSAVSLSSSLASSHTGGSATDLTASAYTGSTSTPRARSADFQPSGLSLMLARDGQGRSLSSTPQAGSATPTPGIENPSVPSPFITGATTIVVEARSGRNRGLEIHLPIYELGAKAVSWSAHAADGSHHPIDAGAREKKVPPRSGPTRKRRWRC